MPVLLKLKHRHGFLLFIKGEKTISEKDKRWWLQPLSYGYVGPQAIPTELLQQAVREVQAAMERATQVDTFSDRRGEVQAAMRGVGYGSSNWT